MERVVKFYHSVDDYVYIETDVGLLYYTTPEQFYDFAEPEPTKNLLTKATYTLYYTDMWKSTTGEPV